MNKEELAPIVLFVYARPEHTRKCLESLKNNPESKYSKLFIYADGPKFDNPNLLLDIQKTREILRLEKWCSEVIIQESEKNKGLAESIIQGVTEIINEYGKVIVLEDDLILSKNFLTLMNQALKLYEDEKSVWHISGWNFPISTKGIGQVFFWNHMICWGWATWKDRWANFKRNPEEIYLKHKSDDEFIRDFNLGNSLYLWNQIEENYFNKIKTWGIFWLYSIYINNGLCLNFTHSLTVNIGFDGTGENSGSKELYKQKIDSGVEVILEKLKPEFSELVYYRIFIELLKNKTQVASTNTFNDGNSKSNATVSTSLLSLLIQTIFKENELDLLNKLVQVKSVSQLYLGLNGEFDFSSSFELSKIVKDTYDTFHFEYLIKNSDNEISNLLWVPMWRSSFEIRLTEIKILDINNKEISDLKVSSNSTKIFGKNHFEFLIPHGMIFIESTKVKPKLIVFSGEWKLITTFEASDKIHQITKENKKFKNGFIHKLISKMKNIKKISNLTKKM
ncbi:MAG: hypothetical protein SFU98_15030 [Leptospiraceae bacterium]|nr:hypothetical protein [Leptospiraceae bacterium]